MKIRARIIIDLEIDPEVYIMPVDDEVTEELIDIIDTSFYDVEGVEVLNATATQKR